MEDLAKCKKNLTSAETLLKYHLRINQAVKVEVERELGELEQVDDRTEDLNFKKIDWFHFFCNLARNDQLCFTIFLSAIYGSEEQL